MDDPIFDLFPPEEQPQRVRINTLMEDWKKQLAKSQVRHRGDGKFYSGDEYFCADGFYPYYYRQKRKILFIAREAADCSGRDYIEGLLGAYRENRIGKGSLDQITNTFHARLMYLTYGILHDGEVSYGEVPPASELGKTVGTAEGISFAFMEISKYSNDNDDAAHRDTELMTASLKDSHLEERNFIREELAILDPDIVLSMNLWQAGIDDALLEIALGKVQPVEGRDYQPAAALHTISIGGKDVPFIDLFHFSSRKDTKTYFYIPVMNIIKDNGYA